MPRRPEGPDEAYAALRDHLADDLRTGRVLEVRREGDEAVLLLRLEAHPPVFGVRVRLDDTTRRLDWDHPATDLEDWLDSVGLWLVEDVENWYAFGASRTARHDHVELGPQVWPDDGRFEAYVEDASHVERLRGSVVAEVAPGAWAAVEEALAADDVEAVVHVHDAGSSDTVGLALARRRGHVTDLTHVWTAGGVPDSVVLVAVRVAARVAASHGATEVTTDLPLPHLDVLGFRPDDAGGWRTDTRFLGEDRAAALAVITSSTADGGPWGRRRDRAGRVLPRGRLGRLLHRLRHGPTGAPRRFHAG